MKAQHLKMIDKRTLEYFNSFTPHFRPERFDFAISFINEHSTDTDRLIDVGCGDGATLWFLMQKTPVRFLSGLDISENYLKRANDLIGCETILGSILDRDLVQNLANTYNFCVLGAVLHHLIDKNRKKSFKAAQSCLRNSVSLVKPGGYLLIFEPTHSPAFIMTIVFYVKKFFAMFSKQRLEIISKWANLGHPVVSYYTAQQVDQMVENLYNTTIVKKVKVDERRLGLIIKRVGVGIIIQKKASYV